MIRIGSTIIDTDNLTAEDCSTIIRELRAVKDHKLKAEELKNKMTDLLEEVNEAGFVFIDKDLGHIIRAQDMELFDPN
jgi:reverse gyrase